VENRRATIVPPPGSGSAVIGGFAVRDDVQALALLVLGHPQADRSCRPACSDTKATTPDQTTVTITALSCVQTCAAME
jgi:hypothetical protein